MCFFNGILVIQERTPANTPSVTYTRGNDLSGTVQGAGGIGGLLARSHGYSTANGGWSTHNYYHADGNGNITAMVNSSEALVASYKYDPFGNLVAGSGSLAGANTYRFSSKEVQSASGIYYYGYRFYYPFLQRWVNQDPIGERAFRLAAKVVKQPRTEIPYKFVSNNPISRKDPLGLDDRKYPWNGSLCNCGKEDVYALVGSGEYCTLSPGECTQSGPDESIDVDGYWVNGKFYSVPGMQHAISCDPDPDDYTSCPKNRGAPSNLPPVHRNLPYVVPPKCPSYPLELDGMIPMI